MVWRGRGRVSACCEGRHQEEPGGDWHYELPRGLRTFPLRVLGLALVLQGSGVHDWMGQFCHRDVRGQMSDCSSSFIVSQSSQRKESYMLVDGNCTSDRHYRKMTEAEAIDDAMAGMLIVVLLFVLPAVPTYWPFKSRNIKD